LLHRGDQTINIGKSDFAASFDDAFGSAGFPAYRFLEFSFVPARTAVASAFLAKLASFRIAISESNDISTRGTHAACRFNGSGKFYSVLERNFA
jgi:hypothetical protein